MHEIPETAAKELAGSLCSDCGGIHVGSADVAILASSIAATTDTEIPFCDCPECPICKKFRQAVVRIMENSV